jgi:hypothetical protein
MHCLCVKGEMKGLAKKNIFLKTLSGVRPTNAEMTFPSADSDRLILVASFSLSPVAPVLDCRSEPARSTRLSLPTRMCDSFWEKSRSQCPGTDVMILKIFSPFGRLFVYSSFVKVTKLSSCLQLLLSINFGENMLHFGRFFSLTHLVTLLRDLD